MQTFTFTVTVDVEHEEGKFATREAIAREIRTSLESAADDHWRSLDTRDLHDNLSSYKVTRWEIKEP